MTYLQLLSPILHFFPICQKMCAPYIAFIAKFCCKLYYNDQSAGYISVRVYTFCNHFVRINYHLKRLIFDTLGFSQVTFLNTKLFVFGHPGQTRAHFEIIDI